MDTSSDNKRIAKNTLFLYIRMGVVLMISLFTTRIFLQSLGVVDYGIANVVGGFVSLFAILNTTLSNSIQRFYNFALGNDKDYSERDVYNIAIRIQIILAIVIAALLETIGLWYIYNEMVIPEDRFFTALWVFQFSVASLVLVVLAIPYNAAIIAHEKMDFFAYVSIFDVAAKLVIAYMLFVYDGDKLILYSLLNLCVTVILVILYISYSKLKFRNLTLKSWHRDENDNDNSLFHSMLSFSWWNMLDTFAYVMKGQGLNMLLNAFFGPVVNAARGISYMVQNAIQGFQKNAVLAFNPQIVQSYASEELDRVRNLFYTLSKISFVVLSTLSVPVILEHRYIFSLWLGDTIPDYTYSFTILILVNMIVSSLNTPVSQVVRATGRIKNYMILTSSIVCAILPVSWLFLRLGYDPTAVYIVSLAMTFVDQIVGVLAMKKVFVFSIEEYIKGVILPLLTYAMLLMVVPSLCIYLFESSLWRFILITCLSVVLSGGLAYLIVLNAAEKAMVYGFIKDKIIRC